MRLIQSRLREVPIYRPMETENDYVGTSRIWEPVGVILADVQPASDRRMVEMYGDRASHMQTLYTYTGADIQDGYGAFAMSKNGEPTHKVVSVMRYSTHVVLTVEQVREWS